MTTGIISMIIEYYRKSYPQLVLSRLIRRSTMVSPEMSSEDPKWWRDERYAIYDLSVNSAAAYPQHNEELRLPSPKTIYTARGYAYGGGGRRITRVEISLDDGKSMSIISKPASTC